MASVPDVSLSLQNSETYPVIHDRPHNKEERPALKVLMPKAYHHVLCICVHFQSQMIIWTMVMITIREAVLAAVTQSEAEAEAFEVMYQVN